MISRLQPNPRKAVCISGIVSHKGRAASRLRRDRSVRGEAYAKWGNKVIRKMEDLCKICASAVPLASARLRISHARMLPCHRLGAHPAPGQQRQDRENESRHRDRARLSSPSLCLPCSLRGQQALAKRAERREMKAGGRQRQPEEILPVDASPDRVGSLAVSQRLTKLHHSHQRHRVIAF